MSLGPTELIIILIIVLVVFGGGRIGEIGGALGKGIREFKGSFKDEDPEPAPPPRPTASTAPPPPSPSDPVRNSRNSSHNCPG